MKLILQLAITLAPLLTAAGFVLFTTSGCVTKYPRLTAPDHGYIRALETLQGHTFTNPALQNAALKRVENLFSTFSTNHLAAHTREVYADQFYFRDGFHLVEDIDSLEAYFVRSAKPLRSCTFTFEEPISNGPDHFLRWRMKVNLHRSEPGQFDEAIGLSHIRFDENGKVIFQQDYWDPTDVLYRKIPIANGLIGYVRSML